MVAVVVVEETVVGLGVVEASPVVVVVTLDRPICAAVERVSITCLGSGCGDGWLPKGCLRRGLEGCVRSTSETEALVVASPAEGWRTNHWPGATWVLCGCCG